MASRMDVVPIFKKVAYSLMLESPDNHVQAPEALGVGVRLVPGVDDGAAAGGGRRHALPDVLGPLAQAEHRAPGGLEHLAGAGEDLP